ncbi:MAG TPA: CYTH domain-containing protein [Pirellulaceae bacterium]|nr:CYTH domain-containing protein [Pirellulaceae bacterium]HMO91609.1 CYTH domain-containing protein [Pirellulaceae bacterium]HMP68306.1 CYTH domain-containing protein [Pirellulaceae bacterium]
MSLEIERKYLVTDDFWKSLPAVFMCQGYLCIDQARTVRVRLAGSQANLTIKSAPVNSVRHEFEYGIPVADAQTLLDICHRPLIEKKRRVVKFGKHAWEIDEFLGENLGLVVAEIELTAADEHFEMPPWIGADVTDDPRFHNSNLVKNPFQNWRHDWLTND